MDGAEERGTVLTQVFEDLGGAPFERRLPGKRRPQAGHLIGQIQRDATVALAKRFHADPYHFTRAHQRVEHRRCVVVCARGQHLALEHRRRNGGALQLFDRIEHGFQASSSGSDAVP